MPVDYEALVQFEESLHQADPKDTTLTLRNIALKIEHHVAVASDRDAPDEADAELDTAIASFEARHDEFTTCPTCGDAIHGALHKPCCQAFVDASVQLTGLEKSYWLAFLNNPTRTINSFPNYTQYLFLQQGVPFRIRALVWRKLFLINYGNTIPEASSLVFKNFQHSYNTETSQQISKDLNRTFPEIAFFSRDHHVKNLEVVLNVYANYDVELGYCQGLLFLVGTLYHHFKDPVMTFHALITIMESETELHDIFTTSLMSSTLNSWYSEFSDIFRQVDHELHAHLAAFADCKVFLFQWWLSFMSSHTPDISLISRIMDFCMVQGWKTGMFKVSLGLLLANKPILMTLQHGDEEVVYQHLLNECKWGLVLKDINSFFGESLFGFKDDLFMSKCHTSLNRPMKSHKRTPSSMMDKLRSLNISSYSIAHSSALSIFSKKTPADPETDSLYSDYTVDSRASGQSFVKVVVTKPEESELAAQNRHLKNLLAKCRDVIDDEQLISDITQAIA